MSADAGTTAFGPSDENLTAAAAVTVQAYFKAFRRRIETNAKRGTPTFKSPEPSALLALAHVWSCHERTGAATRAQALEVLVTLTRPLLEHADAHSIALDVAGLAWAEAYGALPMRQPPLEQLEWVLQSGIPRGAVSGVMGSAWRVAFLATASPLLDWQHRPVAQRELSRWTSYLQSKLEGLAGSNGGDPGSTSLHARLAFALGVAGERAGEDRLVEAANRQLSLADAASALGQSDIGSGVVAQIAASGFLLGHTETASACCRQLLKQRVNEETMLVHAGGGSGDRDEFSPWVLLGLLPAASEVGQTLVSRRGLRLRRRQ